MSGKWQAGGDYLDPRAADDWQPGAPRPDLLERHPAWTYRRRADALRTSCCPRRWGAGNNTSWSADALDCQGYRRSIGIPVFPVIAS